MFRSRAQIRVFAIFVLAFICLNAGGALCVAYCQTFDIAAEPEHCPLKKKAEHCDPSENSSNLVSVIGSHEMDCCPMTVSFFAGPVEKPSFSIEAAVFTPVPVVRLATPVVRLKPHNTPFPAYRGPPLDRRVDRLKHCIIRI